MDQRIDSGGTSVNRRYTQRGVGRLAGWQRGHAAVLVLGLLLGAGLVTSCDKGGGGKGPPTKVAAKRVVPVTVAAVITKPVPVELNTFGTVQTEASIAIKSQVSEVLRKVHVAKGQQIARGDLLFTLDSRHMEIALEQARATLSRDRIQAANAEVEAERARLLVEKKIAAPTEADRTAAEAGALAETVKADEAAVASLQLDLEHCRIYSPSDGRAGNILVHEGNLVQANEVPLVVINQIRPIDVFFAIPQRELARVRTHAAEGEVMVEAALPETPQAPETGRLTFIDNAVEADSGTIRLAATFPNPGERLWPGQYVRVRLLLTVEADAVVAPARAVQTGSEGKYVFVVQEDQTVALRPVRVSRTQGEDAVIAAGLQAGELVVTDGHLQLASGSKIEVRAAGAPTDTRQQGSAAAASSAPPAARVEKP